MALPKSYWPALLYAHLVNTRPTDRDQKSPVPSTSRKHHSCVLFTHTNTPHMRILAYQPQNPTVCPFLSDRLLPVQYPHSVGPSFCPRNALLLCIGHNKSNSYGWWRLRKKKYCVQREGGIYLHLVHQPFKNFIFEREPFETLCPNSGHADLVSPS